MFDVDSHARDRRALIDLVGESRSRSVRIALFGALLHRPNPDRTESEEARGANLRVLADTSNWLDRAAVLLETGADPWGGLPEDHCKWLAEFAGGRAEITLQLRRMADLSADVVRAAEVGSIELDRALDAHYEFRRAGFMGVVGAFCDSLWAALDAERDEDIERAKRSSRAIANALNRLEMIGKHVRLVSLNASIEAARIGQNGRGISVIATEFQDLAQEIQSLAATAKQDVSALAG